MGIPAYVNAGGLGATTGTSATIGLPSTRTTGNIVVCFFQVAGTGKTPTISAGWTLGGSNSSGGQTGYWWWRVLTGSDTNPTVTWTGTAKATGRILQFSGQAASPIGNSSSANGSGTAVSTASVTSTSDNSLIIGAALSGANTLFIYREPSYALLIGSNNTDGSDNYGAGPLNKSGSLSDAYSITATVTGAWVCFGIELKGSGAGATVNERATQVFQEVLFNYTNPNNVRVTQVVLEVLRSVDSRSAPNVLRAQGHIIG